MEIKTERLSVSDVGYAQLNTILMEQRDCHQDGIMNLSYQSAFEEYLYAEKSNRRNIHEELLRISNYSGEFTGNIDVEFLNKYFTLNFRKRLLNNIQKIKKRGHIIDNDIYSRNKAYMIIKDCMQIFEPKIKDLLQSNFIITKIEHISSLPKANDKSGLWHFDPTPIGYGKLFIMLSGSETTDGCTEYLEPAASLKLIENGELLRPVARRTKHLNESLMPYERSICEKGDWLLFLPAAMYHRGSYPTKGIRKVLSINFLRSNYTWEETFDEMWKINSLKANWVASNWPVNH